MVSWLAHLGGLLLASGAACSPLIAADDWPDDDIADNPHQVGADELRFLEATADNGWLHAHNRLSISTQSLTDGWVGLEQCYANLDAVADMEVVYRYRRIRALQVTSAHGIGTALAGERSVSLKNVGHGARLCVSAGVQILKRGEDGAYLMRNGPFHRRFLDGFFPMRVTLDIDFPADRLMFTGAEPRAQTGFTLQHGNGHIHVDTRFTGMLDLEFNFQQRATTDAPQ